MIWLFSLQQRAEFSAIWGQQTQATQQALQDTFSCCGYWSVDEVATVRWLKSRNGTAAGQFTAQAGFCADATFAANQTGCVTPSESTICETTGGELMRSHVGRFSRLRLHSQQPLHLGLWVRGDHRVSVLGDRLYDQRGESITTGGMPGEG